MSAPRGQFDSDRNLLFGILALQLNFIDRDVLVAAMHAWVLDKRRPLGQILLTQHKLTAEQLTALEGVIVQHMKAHGDDAQRGLQGLVTASTVKESLEMIVDSDVQSSVTKLGVRSDPDETRSFATAAPSDGRRFVRRQFHKGGGLGDVYFAEDTELHREVALKEIKPRFADDTSSRERFVLEAEITGGLEHPGIVPVYGLGTYADGRPHYAMRFIRGSSLKEAIERFHAGDKSSRSAGERTLAFRQLLRRFVDVCNAVAYAHSRGVLHRDIKPANVMLGKFGETIVVDWGLAKVGVEPQHTPPNVAADPVLRPHSGSDLLVTRAGTALGTTPYMSPEQALGRHSDVSPASDVYSLGSTLYSLLTGERPYRGTDEADTLAQVQRGQFIPPRELRPDTPPPLDAICRKAMSLAPANRYASALDLAADMEHWLADEPVSAYVEPWTARAGRWARWHRTAVVAVAVLLITATVGLAISTAVVWVEQKKTAAEKERAEFNYELARELNFTGIDLIESTQVDLANNPVYHEKRRDLLVSAAAACRQFLNDDPENPSLQTQAAKVFRYAANFHRLENNFDAAGPLFADSIGLQRRLVEQFLDELSRQDKLAATLRDSATPLAVTGKLTSAAERVQEAIAIIRQLQEANPDHSAYRRSLATALVDLASIEYSRGKRAESKTAAESSVELFTELVAGPAHESHPYDPLLLAAATNRVAIVQRVEGSIDDALALHRTATKMLDDLLASNPRHVVRADILYHRARCRIDQSRTRALVAKSRDGAKQNLAAAATECEGLAKNYPKIPLYRATQADAHVILGEYQAEDAKAADALASFEKARSLLEPLVADFSYMPSYRGDLGRTYLGLGRLARQENNEALAAEWVQRAIDTLKTAADQSPDSAEICRSLEESQTALGR